MARKKMEFDLSVLDNLEVGLDAIAYTSDPAIELIGLAFNKDEPQRLLFKDEVKMQVAGAIMTPKDVYRYSEKLGEYDLVFTYESIQALTKQLMEKLPSLGVDYIFNDEHEEDKKIKAYIYNILFIETEKEQEYIKSKFGYDVDLGATWVVTQVKDRETYDYLVENNKLGFSVEGLFKLSKVAEEQIQKLNNKEMEKQKFTKVKALFSKLSEVIPAGLEVNGDIMAGAEVRVLDEAGEVIEGWQGDLTVINKEGDLEEISVKDGVIVEQEIVIDDPVVEELSQETEVKEEVKEEVIEASEEKEEVKLNEEYESRIAKLEADVEFLIKKLGEIEGSVESIETPVIEEELQEDEELKFKRALSSFVKAVSK